MARIKVTRKVNVSDLVENPTARVAVGLVLDTSHSMGPRAIYPDWVVKQHGIYADENLLTIPAEFANQGRPDPTWIPPIDELNQGLTHFFRELYADELARWAADVAIVTFGGAVKVVRDFSGIDESPPPVLTAFGNTPLGSAVTQVLDLLDQRKKSYQEAGVDYYQPWLVLMTDGRPSDPDVTKIAARRTRALVESKKLTVFPVGIGVNAHLATLAEFSPANQPLRLAGLKFSEFFQWLSQSVSKTTQSFPGEKTELDLQGVKGWATL